jgi:Ran GTPase-activating protein (RanGAP) involved in mRNA processing and transport
MRAISSVNLLKNGMGTDQAKALASILKEHPTLKSLCGNRGNETDLNMSGKMEGAADAIMLVPEIIDNEALSILSLKENNLYAEGGKALATGLKGNQGATELDISSNRLGWKRYKDPDMSGVIALANALPDMGAILSVNLLKNHIGVYQAHVLASILKDHHTLKSLCGNTGNEVELDMSGKMNDAAEAIMLVPEITDKGALTSLHVGMNQIPETEMKEIIVIAMRKESMKMLCEVPIKDKTLTKLDVSGKSLGMEGALVVAEYLRGNGAMTSLNLSDNELGPEGAKHLAEGIKVPFSCLSDHYWLN